MSATERARLTPDAWVGLHLGPSSNHLEERFLAVDGAAAILALGGIDVMTRNLQKTTTLVGHDSLAIWLSILV